MSTQTETKKSRRRATKPSEGHEVRVHVTIRSTPGAVDPARQREAIETIMASLTRR